MPLEGDGTETQRRPEPSSSTYSLRTAGFSTRFSVRRIICGVGDLPRAYLARAHYPETRAFLCAV